MSQLSSHYRENACNRSEAMGHRLTNLQERRGEVAFEKFVEQKWKDPLNKAVKEASHTRTEKSIANPQKTGVAKVVTVETAVEGTLRKGVDSFNYLGEGSNQPWNRTLGPQPPNKGKIIKESNMCIFCMKYAAGWECSGKGLDWIENNGKNSGVRKK